MFKEKNLLEETYLGLVSSYSTFLLFYVPKHSLLNKHGPNKHRNHPVIAHVNLSKIHDLVLWVEHKRIL